MTLSLLAVCSPGKNNLAAEEYMDLDNPSILNYNIASCTVAAGNFGDMHPFKRLSIIYCLDFAIHNGRKETHLKDA